eukprot:scaffold6922_cov363-Prasinococcus_capsulatus_cf.AAC.5
MEALLQRYYGEDASKVLASGTTDVLGIEEVPRVRSEVHPTGAEHDDDFSLQVVGQDEEDDEETLEEEEREAAARGEDVDHEDELNELKNEADLPMEEILRKYYGDGVASRMLETGSTDVVEASPQLQTPHLGGADGEGGEGADDIEEGRRNLSELMNLGGAARTHAVKESVTDRTSDDGEDYRGEDEDEDDEATLDQEEEAARRQGEAQDPDDELNDLKNEAEMSIEEIMQRYYGGQKTEKPITSGEDATLADQVTGHTADDHGKPNEDATEGQDGHEDAVMRDTGGADDNEPGVAVLMEDIADAENSAEAAPRLGSGPPKQIDDSLEPELEGDTREPDLRTLLADDGQPGEEDKGEMSAWREAAAVANAAHEGATTTETPFLLKHELRSYQHAGLDWLVAINEKNLNGILADEMGLGKTIQTIALLAWLACAKGIWGPHLIVVPTSVMLNWETELKKWCPAFKILTYFGSMKERKQKRQGWSKPNSFHVCITTYRLVLQDAKMFRRKKWKYLILDEAHMIKNWRSQRWQTLLNFNSKRRILLTGTPLQNDVMELWSLMHFLMPHIFQSHDQFRNWFSQPLTGMVEGQEAVNRGLVERLHGILRPFILRRLKVDVEKNLPPKIEHILPCRLSRRQRNLYEDFMSRSETRKMLSSGNYLGIANCLMQLRKVCNHPDLFEGRAIVSAFDQAEAIQCVVPSLVYNMRDQLLPYGSPLWNRSAVHAIMLQASSIEMASFEADYISRNQEPQAQITTIDSEFDHGDSKSHVHKSRSSPSVTQSLLHEVRQKIRAHNWMMKCSSALRSRLEHAMVGDLIRQREELSISRQCMASSNASRCDMRPIYTRDLIQDLSFTHPVYDLKEMSASACQYLSFSSALEGAIKSPPERAAQMKETIESFCCVIPAARARAPQIHCSHPSPSLLHQDAVFEASCHERVLPLMSPLRTSIIRQTLFFPDRRLIQYDCGKLQELDTLLHKLRAEGHRALIFTQMTKMLDVLESFVCLHGFTYFRLDGTTKPEQRQILMQRYNTDPRIFLFILSTRSGGVGINLTGADTVIFYDSDWNPAMDAQAQDRCHRIGQTRDVHIYRLVTENTIEENILKKANQKRALDDLVIQDGEFNTDFLKGLDMPDLVGKGKSSSVGGQKMTVEDVEAAMATMEDETDAAARAAAEKEAREEEAEFTEDPPPAEEGAEEEDEGDPDDGKPAAKPQEDSAHGNDTETGINIASKELLDGDDEMLADVVKFQQAVKEAEEAGGTWASQLRGIERYALNYLENVEPLVDEQAVEAAAAAVKNSFDQQELEIDKLEQQKAALEAEYDNDDDDLTYRQWDREAADTAYKTNIKIMEEEEEQWLLEVRLQAERDAAMRTDLGRKKGKEKKSLDPVQPAMGLQDVHADVQQEEGSERPLSVAEAATQAMLGPSKKRASSLPNAPSNLRQEKRAKSSMSGTIYRDESGIQVSISKLALQKLHEVESIAQRARLKLLDEWNRFEDAALCFEVHVHGPAWDTVADALNVVMTESPIEPSNRRSSPRTPDECKSRYGQLAAMYADALRDRGVSVPQEPERYRAATDAQKNGTSPRNTCTALADVQARSTSSLDATESKLRAEASPSPAEPESGAVTPQNGRTGGLASLTIPKTQDERAAESIVKEGTDLAQPTPEAGKVQTSVSDDQGLKTASNGSGGSRAPTDRVPKAEIPWQVSVTNEHSLVLLQLVGDYASVDARKLTKVARDKAQVARDHQRRMQNKLNSLKRAEGQRLAQEQAVAGAPLAGSTLTPTATSAPLDAGKVDSAGQVAPVREAGILTVELTVESGQVMSSVPSTMPIAEAKSGDQGPQLDEGDIRMMMGDTAPIARETVRLDRDQHPIGAVAIAADKGAKNEGGQSSVPLSAKDPHQVVLPSPALIPRQTLPVMPFPIQRHSASTKPPSHHKATLKGQTKRPHSGTTVPSHPPGKKKKVGPLTPSPQDDAPKVSAAAPRGTAPAKPIAAVMASKMSSPSHLVKQVASGLGSSKAVATGGKITSAARAFTASAGGVQQQAGIVAKSAAPIPAVVATTGPAKSSPQRPMQKGAGHSGGLSFLPSASPLPRASHNEPGKSSPHTERKVGPATQGPGADPHQKKPQQPIKKMPQAKSPPQVHKS